VGLGKLGQLIKTTFSQDKPVVKGAGDNEEHEENHQTEKNVYSGNQKKKINMTYVITEDTTIPDIRPLSPVGQAYYTTGGCQSSKYLGCGGSHMRSPFNRILTGFFFIFRPP
jgi:hypothetical protein